MTELADVQDLGSCAERRVGSTPTTRTIMEEVCCMFIFWDNSNIHISGLNAMAEKEPNQLRELFRTNFPNLFALVVFHPQTMLCGII